MSGRQAERRRSRRRWPRSRTRDSTQSRATTTSTPSTRSRSPTPWPTHSTRDSSRERRVHSVSAGPRVLAVMGSGEVAPAMAKVHRALFDRFDGVVPAVILDTPYGFQENADELSARTVEFFATSVGSPVDVASYRSADADAVTAATALARIRDARDGMGGPGSPSYALRQWAGGPIPDALADKLASGGILTMASAAALTLGVVAIPVDET